MKKIELREICHARSGDKGDNANIGLIVYDKKNYQLIKEKVTAECVMEYFQNFVKRDVEKVERYELPKLGALNFVLYKVLDGGTTRSLFIDSFAKTLSSLLLSMEIK